MKQYLFVLLLVLVVALTACSAQDVAEDSQLMDSSSESVVESSSLEVITAVICDEERGYLLYDNGENTCEDGEVAVGIVEEMAAVATCCRPDFHATV